MSEPDVFREFCDAVLEEQRRFIDQLFGIQRRTHVYATFIQKAGGKIKVMKVDPFPSSEEIRDPTLLCQRVYRDIADATGTMEGLQCFRLYEAETPQEAANRARDDGLSWVDPFTAMRIYSKRTQKTSASQTWEPN